MNAKKIMGAVLVALLAAALFIGAGAAADKGTYFVYQENSTLEVLNGTWVNGAATVTIKVNNSNGIVIPGANFVPGTYTKGEDTIFVTNPSATITGIAGEGLSAYSFIGGTYYTSDKTVEITNTSVAPGVDIVNLYVTYPNGTKQVIDTGSFDGYLSTGAAPALGTYTIQAVFDENDFAPGTLASYLISDAVTFTVAEPGSATLTAAADELLKSETIILSITGQPGFKYNVTYDANVFNVSNAQLYFGQEFADKSGFNFTMPNTGKVEFAVVANASNPNVEDEEEITLWWMSGSDKKEKSVTIAFTKGTLTAKTDAASYFIGDVVTVSGTTTAGDLAANYNLSGTNVELINQAVGTVEYGNGAVKTFEFKINTGDLKYNGKKLDVGTYTITIKTQDGTKATVALVLKQPFISFVTAPEVIVQGDDAEFIVNAEATNSIAYYIFGTNYFHNDTTDVNAKDADKEEIKNQFKITLGGKTITEKMDAGQYFMVVQHKMYDGAFNIRSIGEAFYLNTTGEVYVADASKNTFLFNYSDRQTANAAQALCDALDSQNIDDMYAKHSFIVVGEDESFTINEIPAEVAQGETFTVSGTATSAAGEYVTVEMISTAFAAVPKETVGSAAFIVLTTQVADDGTWEVTFDTSDLNVDEYSLKVACGEDTWKNVKINVVEAADEPVDPEQPGDEPEQPGDEPVVPETPGFGALAALAGLGAVAVLLLRRE